MNKKTTYKELEQKVQDLEVRLRRAGGSENVSGIKAQQIGHGDIDQFQKDLSLVGNALYSAKEVDLVLEDILETVFTLFKCDRIWLFYPCDPRAQTFKVLAEKSASQYPGAFTSEQELPVTPEAAITIQKALDSGFPVVFDPESGNELDDVARKFSVLSQMIMAVHPKVGKPWMFGMHQCTHARVWTTYEQQLFREISFRIVESLSNRILLDDLKKSELRYKKLLENLPQKIFYKDTRSVYVSCNSNYAKELRTVPEKIAGTTDYDYFPKDFADKYVNDDKKIIASGSADEFIEKYVAEGQEFWVHTVKVPLFDDKANVSGVLGIFRDISRQKEAEERLRKEKELAQQYLDIAGVMLIVLNSAGEVRLINKKGLEILQASESEVLGKNWFDHYLPERMIDQVKEVFDKLMAGDIEPVEYYENPIRTSSGEERLIAFHNSFLTDEKQQISGILSSGEDITERRQSLNKLRAVNNFNEKILANAVDGIAVCSACDKFPFIRFELWNTAMQQLTGYSKDEINEHGWYQALYPDPEISQRAAERMQKMREGDHLRDEEWTITRQDGSLRNVSISTSDILLEGDAPGILAIMRDISLRKETERASLFLNSVLDQVPVGVALADENLNLYYCNPAGLGMRGGGKDALVEIPKDAFRNWQVFKLDGEPYEVDDLPLVRAFRTGKTIREEFIVRHLDGTDHFCDAHACPVYDGEKIVGGIVIFVDVTERKETEARQTILRSRLEALWKTSRLINADKKTISDHVLEEIVQMTESQYGFYGLLNESEDSMTLYSWSQGVMKDCEVHDKPLAFPIDKSGVWGNAVRTGKPFILNDYSESCENKKGLPEGHVALTRVLSVPIESSGKITAVAAVANKNEPYDEDDVQQMQSFLSNVQILINQKSYEEKLQELLNTSETVIKELDALLDATKAVLTTDDFQICARKIFDSCRQVTGATSGYVALLNDTGEENEVLFLEAGGRPCTVNPDLPMPIRGLREEAYQSGKTVYDNDFSNSKWMKFMPKGHVRLDNVLFAPLNIEGKTVGIMGIANKPGGFNENDVKLATAFGEFAAIALRNSRYLEELTVTYENKIQLEKQLKQATKMEAIGTLAGGIAHDFNNILGVVLGYAEMAKEDGPAGSQYTDDLDKIVTAGNRAKDLVKQILAFSRQTEVERIPLKLQSLVKEAMKMLRASIPTTIEIQENIDSGCGPVLADPTQVNQILMNLCTNANHAMEQSGGVLKIELRRTRLEKDHSQIKSSLKPGQYVELIVSDTGTGIGADVIDKIFDPYFTTKELGKGTGMGLAIIHGIIHEYGGAVTVESELGKGTAFHVYFPSVAEGGVERVKDVEETLAGRGKILFVDDDELLAEMGKDMLERLGYDVTMRCNSIDALSTFQNNPDAFDVVITDQTMPGITGVDLSRRILQIRPDMPIILCTGYSTLIDEHSAKSLGIREFALKPLTRGIIANLLKKVLGSDSS
ncbi:MAG: PAS domain S-box protein [Desulfobulbaceae bacterium]|nr:PAS domain S-box protein [Desulfobulbaceae bacterium]